MKYLFKQQRFQERRRSVEAVLKVSLDKKQHARYKVIKSVVNSKLVSHNSLKTLYQVAMSSLHLQSVTKPFSSIFPLNLSVEKHSAYPSRSPSVQLSPVKSKNVHLHSEQPSTEHPGSLHLSSHLLLSLCPWIIPP